MTRARGPLAAEPPPGGAPDPAPRDVPRSPALRMVLGLGSNLGDRAGHIAAAVDALQATPGLTVLAVAPLYESPPAGGPEQGDYLNSAVLVDSALPPRDVLSIALAAERRLGRVREEGVRWGPRTLDIDVLWIEGTQLEEPGLSVPHPRLAERVFALRPLLDLAPDAADPRSGARYADLPAATLPIRAIGPVPRRPAVASAGDVQSSFPR